MRDWNGATIAAGAAETVDSVCLWDGEVGLVAAVGL